MKAVLNLQRLFDEPSELQLARERRRQAKEAYDKAESRKDTRSIGSAIIALELARRQELAAEVGKR